MRREYQLATYAFAFAMVLFAVSGAIVFAGANPSDDPDTEPADDSETYTFDVSDNEAIQADSEANVGVEFNATVSATEQTCSGLERIDSPDYSETDVEVEDTNLTLVYDDAEPFEEIEHQRFAELVWDDVSERPEFNTYDHVKVHVNQYYESIEREEPRDIVGVTVHPVDRCLPSADAEVNLDDESVDIHRTLPELDDLELAFNDTIEVLDDDEKAIVENVIETDSHASYTIQNQFDDPDTLDAKVIEVTKNHEVDLELTPTDDNNRAVLVTVNLEDESVEQAMMLLSLDESNIVTNESDGEVTFEMNGSTDSD